MADNSSQATTPTTFLSIVRTVSKNWLWVVSVFLLVSGATFAFVRTRVPLVYRAETLILVESQKIPEQLVASTVNAELQDRIATISQEILSATRLQLLIDKFGLYSDERQSASTEELIDRMRKDIQIKLERGWSRNQPGAFHVSYQGNDPEVVAAVVNQMGNFFIDQNLKAREEQASGTSEFLKAQLEDAKKGLEEQEANLSEFKRQHQGELPEQENSFLSLLGNLRSELQGSQDAISRADEKKVLTSTALAGAESSLAAIKSASRSSSRASTDTKLNGVSPENRGKESDVLQAKLQALRARYTDSYPDVQQTRLLLQQAQQREAEAADHQGGRSPSTQGTQPEGSSAPKEIENGPEIRLAEERVATLRAEVAAVERELQDRQADRKKILSDMARYEARLEKLPIREQEMARILRNYQISKSNYEQLLAKDFSADMATDMEKRQRAERFTILDPARTPERPAKPVRPLLYLAGVVSGVLLGLGAAFGREMKRNVVLGEWELPDGFPVLGRVPLMERERAERNSSMAAAA
jgi:succinoglycan biosynthesis transport protein ExoP